VKDAGVYWQNTMAKNPELSPLATHIHHQIAQRLRNLAPDEILPGEIELAAECGVSRTTVRKALQRMEGEGLVRMESGRRVLVRRTRPADLPKAVGEPVSRDQQVVRHVLEQIGSGIIQPGDRISEKKIATALGFSTGPVREGLLSLAPLGLIRKRARRQWEAAALKGEQWDHLMELRQLVEEHCLKKLLQAKLSEEHRGFVNEHLQLTRRMSEASKIDLGELQELDMRFHQWLLNSAGNPVLTERHRFIYVLIEFQLRNSRFTEERARLGLKQHIAIMNAILTGDATEAILTLRAHLNSALNTLKAIALRTEATAGVLGA
jgi:DNA-binding GntR family transcriptional regulator